MPREKKPPYGWAIEKLILEFRTDRPRLTAQAELELRAFKVILKAATNAEIGRVAHVIGGTKAHHRAWMERVSTLQTAIVVAEEVRTGKPILPVSEPFPKAIQAARPPAVAKARRTR